MSELESDPQPDPQLRRALDAMDEPDARAAFRERLRERFLAEPFEEPGGDEALVLGPELQAPEPARLRGERRAEPAPSDGPRRPWATAVAIAAIAAAVLLLYRWPASSGWSVAPTSSYERVRIAGREFGPGDHARLAIELVPGVPIEVEGGTLDLVLDRRLALSAGPGSQWLLVQVPEPDVLAELLLRHERGSLALVTGPDFPGSRLVVQTALTEVRVVGTEFSIDVEGAKGTCVCCGAGTLEVTERREASPGQYAVHASEMLFVFADGQEAMRGPMVPAHAQSFPALRKSWER